MKLHNNWIPLFFNKEFMRNIPRVATVWYHPTSLTTQNTYNVALKIILHSAIKHRTTTETWPIGITNHSAWSLDHCLILPLSMKFIGRLSLVLTWSIILFAFLKWSFTWNPIDTNDRSAFQYRNLYDIIHIDFINDSRENTNFIHSLFFNKIYIGKAQK